MTTQKKIVVLLNHPDVASRVQGLSLLESLADPALLSGILNGECPVHPLDLMSAKRGRLPANRRGSSLVSKRIKARSIMVLMLTLVQAKLVPNSPFPGHVQGRIKRVHARGFRAWFSINIPTVSPQLVLRDHGIYDSVCSAREALIASVFSQECPATHAQVAEAYAEEMLVRLPWFWRRLPEGYRDVLLRLLMEAAPTTDVCLSGTKISEWPMVVPILNQASIRISGSNITHLPDISSENLLLDVANTPLVRVPRVWHLVIDAAQWARWHRQLQHLHSLAIVNADAGVDLSFLSNLQNLTRLRVYGRSSVADVPLESLPQLQEITLMVASTKREPPPLPPNGLWSHPSLRHVSLDGFALHHGLPLRPPSGLVSFTVPREAHSALSLPWRAVVRASNNRRVWLVEIGPSFQDVLNLFGRHMNAFITRKLMRGVRNDRSPTPVFLTMTRTPQQAVALKNALENVGARVQLRES